MISPVCRSLVSEATKVTPEGGQVRWEVMVETKKSYHILGSDNGVGMDEATRQRLCRIAQRVSRMGTSGESGSGLGLIVCAEMAERNGGTLTVKSAVGKGTTFIFSVNN